MLWVFWGNRLEPAEQILPSPRDRRQRDQKQRSPPLWRQDPWFAYNLGGESGPGGHPERPAECTARFEPEANRGGREGESPRWSSLLRWVLTRRGGKPSESTLLTATAPCHNGWCSVVCDCCPNCVSPPWPSVASAACGRNLVHP